MSYLDLGYSDSLEIPFIQTETSSEFSDLQADQAFSEISGGKIRGGTLVSKNGRLLLDLENNTFIINDGAVERIRLGRQEDGSDGLLIKDKSGNTLMQITGDTNVIKSPDETLELNFDNTQLLVKDIGGLVRVLVGKDINGF